MAFKPFRVEIPDAQLLDLAERLAKARVPPSVTNDTETSKFGIPHGKLLSLLDHWKNKFDWRAQEALINSLPMFTADIDGSTIHFVHLRSSRPDARPLILIHGWPGSFHEFHKVARQLADPSDPKQPAFHIVIPSIPGFAFSSAVPHVAKFTPDFVASVFVKLMGVVGYTRFFAQGGDWGSFIVKSMAIHHPGNCVAIHLNLAYVPVPQASSYLPKKLLLAVRPELVLTKEEIAGLVFSRNWAQNETGYMKIQGSKPFTLGVGLNDSPLGLLSWIGEKLTWAATEMDVDDLLTNISIYWFTQSITSSFRLYKDTFGQDLAKHAFISVPTAVAIFQDIFQPPEEWVRYACNLQQYTRMPRGEEVLFLGLSRVLIFSLKGGHFAALEEPELLVADMRLFFGKQLEIVSKI
ncbi:hypothetical protein HDU98_002014 [Podochytrium sp. JEL0797]|nr:hypothetical protein HDU98_002014 [Podochytrium sp. JEL0797]